jgi:hypothetical protein
MINDTLIFDKDEEMAIYNSWIKILVEQNEKENAIVEKIQNQNHLTSRSF